MTTFPSSLDASVPAPDASVPSPKLCEATLEELQEQLTLTLIDNCPVPGCGLPVARHLRRSAPPLESLPSASSHAPKSLVPASTNTLWVVAKHLPKWNKSTSCYPFIQRLKDVMPSSGLPPSLWSAIFGCITEPDDFTSLRWITDNIVNKKLEWEQACEVFTAHFQSYDHRIALEHQYETCKQGKTQTAQAFSDFFTSLCAQLDYDTTSTVIINRYFSALQPAIYKRVADWRVGEKIRNKSFAFKTLRDAIDVVIEFEQSDRATHLHAEKTSPVSSTASATPVSTSRSSSNSKFCSFHQSNSHSTSECLAAKKQSSNPLPQSVPAMAKMSTFGSNKPSVTCHACQQPGHYANECPQRGTGTSSVSSTAKNSVKTETSTDSTSSAVRHSTRPSNPPERFTPSVRAVNLDSPETIDPVTDQIGRVGGVVFFMLDSTGSFHRTLIDTGSDTSIIARHLADELKLDVTPVAGTIDLAVSGVTAPRQGITAPLSLSAVFPMSKPHISQIRITHSFEVAPFAKGGHEFIIGTDLLSTLFPEHIPRAFYLRPQTLSSANPSVSRATIIDKLVDDIQSAQIDPSALMNDMIGIGTLPVEENRERFGVSTPESMEGDYAAQRDALMRDPRIEEALAINENISGFCNLPSSEVRLHVDPALEHTLYRRQYPIPQAAYEAVDEIVNRWLEEGRIVPAPADCRYNSALVVTPKKDAYGNFTGFRVCLDTRALNKALTVVDRFPLPYIRHVLENFLECVVFGEFDLSEAYLQFLLHPDSRQYTAFTWKGRQYMFVGCPFGICLLPSHFQRVMSSIFHGLTFTVPYLDNLPFGSKTWAEHREQALEIISRLNSVNLKIKPSSVKIGHAEIRCLGHLLTGQGVALSPSKLDQVRDWPLPQTCKQLQTFIGFAIFLRHHIRHFADITAPLEAIKNGSGEIQWTDKLREHFDLLKHALAHAPVLQFPDPNKPMCIATDASNTGVGGVLYQPDDVGGEMTPFNMVSIVSSKLSKSQLNYPAYKKELWAIVYCLRQFHAYIWGRTDLTVFTDHKPLTYMFQSTELSVSLQQWLDVILDHRFDIVYRPGILNVVPDALSRLYASAYKETWGVSTMPFKVIGAPPDSDSEELVNGTPSCITVAAVTRSQSTKPSQPNGIAPGSAVLLSSPNSFAALDDHVSEPDSPLSSSGPQGLQVGPVGNADALQPDSLSSTHQESTDSGSDQLLQMFVELDKRGKVAPATDDEKSSLIQREHLFGHFGVTAVYKALFNKGFWWPKMRQSIQEELSSCDPCARFTVVKSGFNPASFITSGGPWDHIQIDTSVHLPPSPGPNSKTAMLVVIDVFTGFVLLRPIETTKAEIIARELWEIFCVFGVPKIIQSDNGREFVNEVIRCLVALTGMDHRLISPYNPRADGKVERSIGTTMSIIKKLLHGTETCWPMFAPFAQLSFNNKVATLTNSTPFSLMFGRALNELKDYTTDPPTSISWDDWKAHQEKISSLIYPAIIDVTKAAKTKMISALDKHRRVLLSNAIPNGAIVMLRDPDRTDKFQSPYIGRYTVIRRTRKGNYILHDGTDTPLDRSVPPDQLKLISKKPRPSDLASDEFEVQEILGHRGSAPNFEYYVKWKHHNARTWEPASNFLDDMVIRNYWSNLGAPPTSD